jgi:hypothetical protein
MRLPVKWRSSEFQQRSTHSLARLRFEIRMVFLFSSFSVRWCISVRMIVRSRRAAPADTFFRADFPLCVKKLLSYTVAREYD